MRKTGRKVFFLLLLITLPLLTSCFKDSDAEDYDRLSDEEVSAYLKKMHGDYKGKCYYSYIGIGDKGIPVVKQDSIVDVQWTLKENGSLTFSKMPVSFFANSLRAGSQFDFLANEISECEDITVETNILPYRAQNAWNYPFYIFPKENIILNVEKDGKKYKVVLQYSSTIEVSGIYYGMQGECLIHKNQMFVQLPIGASFINDVQTGVTPSMFKYVGMKKESDKTK